ncbi:MAG: hypothetical protein AB1918_04105 [Pseudomonadota bacterium]
MISVIALVVSLLSPSFPVAQEQAPDLAGLLVERGAFDLARTNAALAQRHTKAALRQTDLAAMKAEVVAAVHAIDPSLVPQGAAVGPGLRSALAAAVERLLALQATGGEGEAGLRATAASVAGQTALMRTDEALREAWGALAAASTSQAIPSLVRLDDQLNRIQVGQDVDGDGQVSWNQGEGGIQQAWSFTRQMAIAEGVEVARR